MTKAAIFAGAVLCFAVGASASILDLRLHHDAAMRGLPSVPLKVRLYRFELKPDHLDDFEKWVAFERTNPAATLATLEGEKMYFEAVMHDPAQEPETIYWIAVDGPRDVNVTPPTYPIDVGYRELEANVLKPVAAQDRSRICSASRLHCAGH
jgi:hypothetical protein